MKYSLANKEFKKRNHIFGERKQQNTDEDIGNQRLDCINQLGEDLQDSKSQKDIINDRKSQSISQYVNFTTTKKEEARQKINSFHKIPEVRAGRHGLSPNIKPSIPIIRTAPPISTVLSKPKQLARRPLTLESNVIQFHHFSEEAQVEFAELKQLTLKLYMILSKNNEKISYLEQLLYILTNRNNQILKQLHFCLSNAVVLDSKIDLFLNTMRNVYQNLRISRLKQENLELYLKQAASSSPQSKANALMPLSKLKSQNLNSHQQPFKEAEQLMSLLEYQSDSSVVQPYHSRQREQKNKGTLKSNQKVKQYEQKDDNLQINQKKINFRKQQHSTAKETFRVERNQFQRLSPFEANRLMSNTAESFFYDAPKVNEESKFNHLKQSPKSNWSYSFEADGIDKYRTWCRQRGEERMPCWLDEMGCLRRPNMTYVFWPNGEVMRLTQKVFFQLESEGLIQNWKRGE